MSQSLRVVFAGTPEFSLASLQQLLDSEHELLWVYTQPDRRSGRGKKKQFSAVKRWALQHNVPCLQPEKVGEPEAQALRDENVDVVVVVAYGQIVPKVFLRAPRFGCLNVHASALPRWRGAAPIQRAILAGDTVTAAAVMQMEEGLDTGPVFRSDAVAISATTTAGELSTALAFKGAAALLKVLGSLGDHKPVVQSLIGVCYAPKVKKQEAHLDWSCSASELDRVVRAFSPSPTAFFYHNDVRLRVLRATPVVEADFPTAVGQVFRVDEDGVWVRCGSGSLMLQVLQLPGKKPLPVASAVDFFRGFFLDMT